MTETLIASTPFMLMWCMFWAVFVLFAWHMKGRRRHEQMRMLHEERLRAIDKGVPLPELPSIADAIHGRPRRPVDPDRLLLAAYVTGSVGSGIMAAFLVMGNHAWPIGLIPMFLAIGLFWAHSDLKK